MLPRLNEWLRYVLKFNGHFLYCKIWALKAFKKNMNGTDVKRLLRSSDLLIKNLLKSYILWTFSAGNA